MPKRVITFTNLFPSAEMPTMGLFVRERMKRVVAELGWDWVVVSPVAHAPRPMRFAVYRQHARIPATEVVDGVTVHHPRYLHVPKLSLKRQANRMYRGCRALMAELVRGHECVIDAHYAYPDGVAALRLGEELGLKVIVTARGSDVLWAGRHEVVAAQLRALAPQAHALLAVSGPLREAFAEVVGLDQDRVEVVRNGVNLDLFRPGDQDEARQALGLPRNCPMVLGVGRLVPAKGFRHVVRAMHEFADAVLVLVGVGPEQSALAKAAPSGRVHFLGGRPPDEVAVALRAADVLVLPSQREGWPNVVTEAQASGLPVVASPVGSVPVMLDDPELGTLIDLEDEHSLVTALRHWLDHPADRAYIRSRAERWGWQQPVERVAAILRSALS